ncbi:MAG TPA: helix-turn-helix domain-containing protein, partial [Methylomirabilota bacterium]|nr:helix-turn-helix domain-containing protein [Methylomirabilota bacterium]
TKEEKRVLVQIAKGQIVTNEDKAKAVYLWDTGFVINETVFSSLLKYYLLQKDQEDDKKEEIIHLTRKEHLFFSVLEGQKGEICEREKIIETVWPEYKDFGVSDWAIDRLVARVRVKLRKQKSDSEIVTVRTRGYKLSSIKE